MARAAAELSADGHGALIVLERETGLEEVAETGVMIHGDVSADLLQTIFTPRSALHDGAVIIREDRIVAAGALLPLAETSIHTERFGTRHRAALGITEQTDAVVIVVSEENGQISLVERARIVRNLTEAGLARAIQGFLDPAGGRRGAFGWRAATERRASAIGSRRLESMRRLVRRPGRSPGPPDAAVTRFVARLVHNWPLKLAAIGLATLLYGGLVLSAEHPDPTRPSIPIKAINEPPGSFLLTTLDPVTEIRYFAPSGTRPLSSDLRGDPST